MAENDLNVDIFALTKIVQKKNESLDSILIQCSAVFSDLFCFFFKAPYSILIKPLIQSLLMIGWAQHKAFFFPTIHRSPVSPLQTS